MTSDPRWPDDSPEEDAEAHRPQELARLDGWMGEQKTRPLTDVLEEHGLQGRNPGGESCTGPPVPPDWWDDVPSPPRLPVVPAARSPSALPRVPPGPGRGR